MKVLALLDIPAADQEKLCYRNAETLFGLRNRLLKIVPREPTFLLSRFAPSGPLAVMAALLCHRDRIG
ncbi:MAG: hypothetical protein AB7E84_09705 [Xanthobacteraceae bacterium]